MPPSWLNQAMARRQQASRLAMPIETHSRGRWRARTKPVWSCVPVPGCPVDQACLAAIREFFPDAIAMTRKRIWSPPDSDERIVAVHHAIGHHVPHFLARHGKFHVEMPVGATHPAPNIIDYQHPMGEVNSHTGAPLPYLPFDWAMVAYLRASYVDGIDLREWDRQVRREREKEEDAQRAHDEELAWRQRRIEKRLGHVLSEITPDDLPVIREFHAEERRKRRKTMVTVGGVR